MEVPGSSEEVVVQVQSQKEITCTRCEGRKWEPDSSPQSNNFGPCFKCEGRGTITLLYPCGCWWSAPPNAEDGFGTWHVVCQDHYEVFHPA